MINWAVLRRRKYDRLGEAIFPSGYRNCEKCGQPAKLPANYPTFGSLAPEKISSMRDRLGVLEERQSGSAIRGGCVSVGTGETVTFSTDPKERCAPQANPIGGSPSTSTGNDQCDTPHMILNPEMSPTVQKPSTDNGSGNWQRIGYLEGNLSSPDGYHPFQYVNDWEIGTVISPGAIAYMGKVMHPFRKYYVKGVERAGDTLVAQDRSCDQSAARLRRFNSQKRTAGAQST